MNATVFVSHSFLDGTPQTEQIVSFLRSRSSIRLWSPSREMRLGVRWLVQAAEVIEGAHAVLLVMTPDALQDASACRVECTLAQQLGVPVIPVRASTLVNEYPQFIWPGTIWADATDSEGLARLSQEFLSMLDGGRAAQQIPKETWDAKNGPFAREAGLYVGRWLVKRRPIRRRIEFTPDYVTDLYANSRFEEHATRDRRGVAKVVGTWGLNHDGVTLMFAVAQTVKELVIDSSYGPNIFGGETSNARFVARRMLEI